jgi:hypothetical protein
LQHAEGFFVSTWQNAVSLKLRLDASHSTQVTILVLPLSPNLGQPPWRSFRKDGLLAACTPSPRYPLRLSSNDGPLKVGVNTSVWLVQSLGKSHYALFATFCQWFSSWTRGTGLMRPTNIVAHELESHGVRTFSAKEMAFNILGLTMHPLLFSPRWYHNFHPLQTQQKSWSSSCNCSWQLRRLQNN